MTEEETCSRCGQPKNSYLSGTITQWMAICQCDLIIPSDRLDSTQLCSKCSKRIHIGSVGSLTQWIFQADTCECKIPSPTTPKIDSEREKPASQIVSDGNLDIYLSLDERDFPIHRYKPLKKLGSGGRGAVYLARDTHLDKPVAVKVLHQTSEEELISFQREAKVTAKLKHQNVIGIIDFGVVGDSNPYMVLNYVNGVTLEQMLTKNGVPDDITALEIFGQIADALSHGHKLGIFHRDIKTSNILVTMPEDESPKIQVIDFGVAALIGVQEATTVQGQTLVGTPRYMPPDQALGRVYDERSEIYSFGCLMYEVLTGAVPFVGNDALELITKHSNDAVPPFKDVCAEEIERPESFEKLVLKCLEKDPSQRYQTMDEVVRALTNLKMKLEGLVVSKVPVASSSDDVKPKQGQKLFVFAGIFAIVFIVFIVQSILFFEPDSTNSDSKEIPIRLVETHPVVDYKGVDLQKPMFEITSEYGFNVFRCKDSRFTDEDFKKIKPGSIIQAIKIKKAAVTGSGFKYLKDFPITSFWLERTPLTDDGMKRLGTIKSVSNLTIRNCPNITNEGIKSISHLPLVKLFLDSVNISNHSLKYISNIKTLVVLHLKDTGKIDAVGLKYLKENPNLKELQVSTSRDMKQDFWKVVASLSLDNLIIFDQGNYLRASDIALFRGVHKLEIVGTKLDQNHLLELSKLPKLRILKLDGNGINDGTIYEVAKLPLKQLGLFNQKVTDIGFHQIEMMKHLDILYLDSDDSISRAMITKLRKVRPDYKIIEERRGNVKPDIYPTGITIE